MKLISIIVPCYNEEDVLPLFYEELGRIAGNMTAYSFEFIFVNDGSSDGTLDIIKKIAAQDKRVRYYSFSRNFGKEAAMYAGFVHSKGEYTAVMDADLQDPPELLPEMVSILETGEYDSVATRRVSREGEPRIRSFFARQFYKLMNKISDAEIMDGARDFRLMNRKMLDALVSMGEYNRFSKGIFGWVGFRTKWLEYKNTERAAGETKWSFFGLLKYSIEGIVNFSSVPLSIASFGGILFTLVSIVIIIFIIVRKLIFGDPVSGWASTVCIIFFIGGVQLFCVGIMGQYVSKTYLETKKRPHFIISDTNDNEKKNMIG